MTTISERLRLDSKGDDAFVAIVPLHGIRHEAADTIDALVAALEEALPYVASYESEHMSNVALAVMTKAEAALALARKGG